MCTKMLQGSVLEMLSHLNIWGNILNSDYHESLSSGSMHVPENNRFTGTQEMAQWVNSRLLEHFFRLRLSRIGSRYRFRVRPEMAK